MMYDVRTVVDLDGSGATGMRSEFAWEPGNPGEGGIPAVARLEVCKIRKVSRLEVEDRPLTVGRASDNAVVLSNTHVSRHHCVIEFIDGKPRVRDLESSTGTFLNGKRVTDAPLTHGDRITVGPFDLRFRDPGSLPASDSAASDASAAPADSAISLNGSAAPDHALDEALAARRAALDERESALLEREAAATAREARAVDREAKSLERETRLARREVELSQKGDKLDRRTAEIEAAQADLSRRTAEEAEVRARALAEAEAAAASVPTPEPEPELKPEPDPSIAEFEAVIASLRLELEQAAKSQAEEAEKPVALRTELEESASLLAASRIRVSELESQHAAGLKAVEEAQAAVEDWRSHADLASKNLAARTEELDRRAAAAEALETQVAELLQQREERQADHEAALGALQVRLDEQVTLGKSLLDQLQQAERQAQADAEASRRLIEVNVRELELRGRELAAKQTEITALRNDLDAVQQRLRQAEAVKQSVAERAERAGRIVDTLRSQVSALDAAAERVTSLQSRLVQIEAAWVQASEQIDEAEDAEAEELEAVVEERHRMSVELDALNQQRDAAVATLRDSALRLRAIAEHSTPAPHGQQLESSALPPSRPSPRKWWRRGG